MEAEARLPFAQRLLDGASKSIGSPGVGVNTLCATSRTHLRLRSKVTATSAVLSRLVEASTPTQTAKALSRSTGTSDGCTHASHAARSTNLLSGDTNSFRIMRANALPPVLDLEALPLLLLVLPAVEREAPETPPDADDDLLRAALARARVAVVAFGTIWVPI